uniref:Reverse transcriptase domain-containing protein n=1 Tax=Oryzias latipes TaxID=8090 RepID=A0A3P9L7Z4_ORYLA
MHAHLTAAAPLACVQVNELKTGWFSTPFGVKQGDVLSPTLFSIYVNDLAQEIKKTNLADEEIKLQGMLNTMNNWCNKWRLTINSDKTQIVHFRKPLVPQSNFLFYFGKTTLMFTDTYKYLGFKYSEMQFQAEFSLYMSIIKKMPQEHVKKTTVITVGL